MSKKKHLAVNQRLELLRQTRCSELAKLLGKNHATLSRDRGDLKQWRADELLILGAIDPELRHAVISALNQHDHIDNIPNTFRTVVDGLSEMATLSQTIALAIADQRVDAQEARLILSNIHRMNTFIQKILIPSLESLEEPK
jgi:hypothetical protein